MFFLQEAHQHVSMIISDYLPVRPQYLKASTYDIDGRFTHGKWFRNIYKQFRLSKTFSLVDFKIIRKINLLKTII